MKAKWIVVIVIALAIVAIIIYYAVSPSKMIRLNIGTLLDYTGPLKEFGPNIKNGCELAAKQLSEAGLDVKLFHEDSETSAIPGTNAAKKLVEVNKVLAIVGSLASGVTIPVAESVTIPAGVVQISPASTSPLISVLPTDQGKDLLYRTCPSDALQGVIAGKLANDLGYKTASVLYVNNPYGQGLAEEFKKSFEKQGGKVLVMVPHDEKAAESYTAELKKAMEGKPNIICAFSYPEHGKVYIKEAIEFFKFKKFLFCDGTKSFDIIKAVGASNVEGQYGTVAASAKGDTFDIFVRDYTKGYGQLPPLPYITNGYDAVAVIGLAAYACKAKGLPITSKNIKDHLRFVANPPGEVIKPGEFKKAFELLDQKKDINFEGASGSVDFDDNGDVITPIEIWQYQGGNIVTVRLETPKE
jgi:ABC-type branched-subunit amino acid transport system substrate-binding protein